MHVGAYATVPTLTGLGSSSSLVVGLINCIMKLKNIKLDNNKIISIAYKIENFINKINTEIYDNKIVTEVQLFNNFYEAEEYHQNYYQENNSASYCRLIISPKVIKAKKELSNYYE